MRNLKKWRRSLRPGDPVRFIDTSGNIAIGDIAEIYDSHYILIRSDKKRRPETFLRLYNEIHPINKSIVQAPQRCDLDLSRPIGKRQVDQSGRRARSSQVASGLRRLFSFFLPARRLTPAHDGPWRHPEGGKEKNRLSR